AEAFDEALVARHQRAEGAQQHSRSVRLWQTEPLRSLRAFVPRRSYRAAMIPISTVNWGAASFASTQARAGVLPGATQLSHTEFISAKVPISASQIVADSSRSLLDPAYASSRSIEARMSRVCSATGLP